MQKFAIFISALSMGVFLEGCGAPDTRNQVVYPVSPPIPRHAEYRGYPSSHSSHSSHVPDAPASPTSCPGDSEELAPGSICPPSARCFDISGGRRCISYEN
ncbi:hypothetical protein ACJJIE_20635 [Microbulbifer sp. TRSA001]|uniref:hypothetical protein n=1 Tax=Microbulbifer sp. TRSA001 TaxID=3243381 RepID=UPI0040392C51